MLSGGLEEFCVEGAEAPQCGFCHQVPSPVLPWQWGPVLWDFQGFSAAERAGAVVLRMLMSLGWDKMDIWGV